MTFRCPLAWMALLLAASAMPAQEIVWRKDYGAALKEAKEKGRPLLLNFTMIGCHWCNVLDTTTFRDPVVSKALGEQFVPLKVWAEDYPALVEALGVKGFPTLIVAGPTGRILEIQRGYVEAAPFKALLARAAAKLPAEAPAAVAAKEVEKTPSVQTAAPKEPAPTKTAAVSKEAPAAPPPVVAAPAPASTVTVQNDNVPVPPGPPVPGAVGAAETEPAWMGDDFRKAAESVGRSEYGQAVPLLRRILQDENRWPVQAQAESMLREVERKAAERLAQLKDAEQKNCVPEAVQTARDLIAQFDGTPSAREAQVLLSVLETRLEGRDHERMKSADTLLRLAREDFQANQFLPCLLRCEEVVARYSDLPQASAAGDLAGQIKNHPERLQKICDGLPAVLGQVYLMTAEVKIKQGEPQQAVFFLERVMQAFPSSKHAEMAQVRLSQIQGPPALSAGDDKKP